MRILFAIALIITIAFTLIVRSSCEALWEHFSFGTGQHPALSIFILIGAFTAYGILIPRIYDQLEHMAKYSAHKY